MNQSFYLNLVCFHLLLTQRGRFLTEHFVILKTHVAKQKNTFGQISQEKFQTCSLIDNSQFTQKISFPKIPKTPPVCDLNLDSEEGADAFN